MTNSPLQVRLVLAIALVSTFVWALLGPPPLSWPTALVVAAIAGGLSILSLRRAGSLMSEGAAPGEDVETRVRRVVTHEAVAVMAAVVAIGFVWDSLRGHARRVPIGPIVQIAPTQFRITINPPARGPAGAPAAGAAGAPPAGSPAPPPRADVAVRRKELTLSLFFANGSSRLRPDNRRYLDNIAGALGDCGSEFTISVAGYASARPFKKDNDSRNLALANARAASVSKALAPRVRGSVAPVVWPSLVAMEIENVINDRGSDAGIVLSSESLARRADLVLQLPGRCERSRQTTPTPQK